MGSKGRKRLSFAGKTREQRITQGMSVDFPNNRLKRGPKKLGNKVRLRLDERKRCYFLYFIFLLDSHMQSNNKRYVISSRLRHKCSRKSLNDSYRVTNLIQIYFILLYVEVVK